MLVPGAISRAISRRASEREQRTSSPTTVSENILELLETLTETLRPMVFGQYLARRTIRERSQRPGLDPATINESAVRDFDGAWKQMHNRIAMVPGKDVLALLNQYLQRKYDISLSALSIANAMTPEEIGEDLRALVDKLELFRKTPPPTEA